MSIIVSPANYPLVYEAIAIGDETGPGPYRRRATAYTVAETYESYNPDRPDPLIVDLPRYEARLARLDAKTLDDFAGGLHCYGLGSPDESENEKAETLAALVESDPDLTEIDLFLNARFDSSL